MSRSKLVPLVKSILPEFSGFATKGRMLFVTPIDQTLRGIMFEPSAFGNIAFDIVSFVMPLCVPSDHISFSFALDIEPEPRGTGWHTTTPNLVESIIERLHEEALPFLSARAKLLDFVDATLPSDTFHKLKARAYSYARAGHTEDAVATLDQLLAKGTEKMAWEVALVDEARYLRAKLVDDPATAQHQLIAWENATVENLGLTRFRKGG